MSPRVALLLASAAALAACSPKGQHAAAPGATPPAIAPGAPMAVSDLPQPRAGAWETTTSTDMGMPASTVRLCIKPGDNPLGRNPEGCTPPAITRTLTGMSIRTSCKAASGETRMQADMSGDFQTAYKVAMTITLVPPPPGAPNGGVVHMTSTSKYLGACSGREELQGAPTTGGAG